MHARYVTIYSTLKQASSTLTFIVPLLNPESVKFSLRVYLHWYFAPKHRNFFPLLHFMTTSEFCWLEKNILSTRIFQYRSSIKTSAIFMVLCKRMRDGYKSLLCDTLFRNHTVVLFCFGTEKGGRGLSDRKKHTWSVALHQASVGAAVNVAHIETTTPLIFWSVWKFIAVLFCI